MNEFGLKKLVVFNISEVCIYSFKYGCTWSYLGLMLTAQINVSVYV